MQEQKERVLINKFQSLLRCGKDYSVDAMYEEAGIHALVGKRGAREIVNKYYRSLVTEEMIVFVGSLDLKTSDQLTVFSERFNVCIREARLLIRYIKIKKDGK